MTLSVQIKHRFQDFTLDVDFQAPAGVTVLFGQSGSGKTTLINAIAGLLRPDQGRVMIHDRVLLDTDQGVFLPPAQRRIGYIFQEGRLFPHLSVRQNLLYGRWFSRRFAQQGNKNAPAEESLDKVVEMLGIGGLLERRPTGLSGGEKQRVAIGRALLARPRLILADEPLAALDEARKAEILPYFERLRDEVEIPIFYVSHSPSEVARLATSVVALEQGRVQRQGRADVLFGDPSFRPAGIRAVGAVLQARVQAHHDDGLSELDAGGVRLFLPRIPHAPGQTLRFRIAAQDVLLSRGEPVGLSALNVFPGVIDAIETGDGPGAIVSVCTKAGTVLARVTRRSAAAMQLAVGVECHAIVKTVSIAPEDVGARPGG